MTGIEERFDKAMMGIVSRLSGRGVAILAFAIYAGGGLALPLTLRWSTTGLVVANFLATSIAGIIMLFWLVSQVQASHRRHLMEWTTNLRLLSAQEFEWLVGELFRREGWQVKETGRQDAPDGNVDLELRRDGRRMIVQCKNAGIHGW